MLKAYDAWPCRSDPCHVYNCSSDIEGRYGAALFIKPAVMAMNIRLWAEFDQQQQEAMERRAAELTVLRGPLAPAADTDLAHEEAGTGADVGVNLDVEEDVL